MRRTCPACGRDFKTEINPNDLQWALNAYCQNTSDEIGVPAQGGDSVQEIQCPYCAHKAESNQMLTEETLTYLKRIAYREYIIPKLNNLFAGLENSLAGGGRSGGFISMSIQFTHSRSVLPVRPMHGPEPADFKIINFLCCNKKIKVSDSWVAISLCSFCGAEVMLS